MVTLNDITSAEVGSISVVVAFRVPLSRGMLDDRGRQAAMKLSDHLPPLVPGATWAAVQDDDGDWQLGLSSELEIEGRILLARNRALAILQRVPNSAINPSVFLAKFIEITLEQLECKPGQAQTEVKSIWQLTDQSKNVNLVRTALISNWDSSPFAEVVTDTSKLGRFDVKLSWDLPDNYRAFLSLELPANDESSTVWISLAVTTGDASAVRTQEQIAKLPGIAIELFATKGAEFLAKFLGSAQAKPRHRDT